MQVIAKLPDNDVQAQLSDALLACSTRQHPCDSCLLCLLSFVAGVQVIAKLPDNDVQAQLSDALGLAVRESGIEGAVVLMVVQPGETNAYDQQVSI